MVISTKFDIHQKVLITEIGIKGRVVEITMAGSDMYYRVQYFNDNVVCFVNLYEDELQEA